VKLSGIKVGSVIGQSLDPESYQAVLTLTVESAIKLPVDTVAQISSEGLLGGAFVQLVPGAEDKMLAAGGQIKYTQAPVNLVQMLGKFMFNSAESSQAAPKN
jgi:phospholipid/cholesterol/gamma-HCH transport system substrate-binding protein